MVTMTDSQKLDFLVEQFIDVKKDISEMKEDIAELKSEMAEVKADIVGIKGEIAGIKGEIAEIKCDIAEMRDDIRDLQERMDRQENETRYIKIFQENVLKKGIDVIAEGHMDLLRKLNESLKKSESDEMLRLRVNVLECDMCRVKDKLAIAY